MIESYFKRYKQEYMENEITEEMTNYQNYSNRRRRELKKKHAFETKQHPKNLKVIPCYIQDLNY